MILREVEGGVEVSAIDPVASMQAIENAALTAVAIGAGVMRGIMTLLQATAVTERWGATHYGQLSALLNAPVMIATAVGPFAGAALASALGGYPAMFVALGLVAAAGAALAVATSSGTR